MEIGWNGRSLLALSARTDQGYVEVVQSPTRWTLSCRNTRYPAPTPRWNHAGGGRGSATPCVFSFGIFIHLALITISAAQLDSVLRKFPALWDCVNHGTVAVQKGERKRQQSNLWDKNRCIGGARAEDLGKLRDKGKKSSNCTWIMGCFHDAHV